MDFSKAFDKVAHEKILLKLHHYCIRRDTLKIKDFLDNRKQAVIISGINSDKISISSGVQQGSVLGPILYLAYINDLPEQVKTRVRLLQMTPLCTFQSAQLQKARSTNRPSMPRTMGKDVDMQFNPSKCQVLQITKRAKPLNTKYILHYVEMESVSAAKYLGVTIEDELMDQTYQYYHKKKPNFWLP